MLNVSVDEFTLILQSNNKVKDWEVWNQKSLDIIDEIEKKTQFKIIFGECQKMISGLPQGYTEGYTYGQNPFYFCIAYHPDHIEMGVIIKFSAYSWAVYQQLFLEINQISINIHSFLQKIQSKLYSFRLSRIDIAIDFINENFSVNTIYNQLSKGNQIIKNVSGRKNSSSLTAYCKNNIVSTFYIGSKSKNIKALLRVYDKKKEQEENFGFRYHEAVQSHNWTRFEAVYKGNYAHTLSERLFKIQNDSELRELLVSAFTDRYRFFYKKSNQETKFTKKMLSLLNQNNYIFSSPSPRDNQLSQSIKYLVTSSGLFSTIYKINEIWGQKGLEDFIDFLENEYANYEANEDIQRWIKKYGNLYKIQGQPF